MRYVSFSLILTLILGCYVIHTIWTLAELFIPPKCSRGDRCLSSYLTANPVQHLLLFTSVNPDFYVKSTLQKVYTGYKFDYTKPTSFDVNLKLTQRTLNNGTLYMHAMLVDDGHETMDYSDIWQSESIYTLPLIIFTEPQATTFNLLESKEELIQPKTKSVRPFSHIATNVPLGVLSEDLKLPANKIPAELYSYIKLRRGKYLPIVQHNVLKSRLSHYKLVNSTMTRYTMTVSVAPISYGSLRLSVHIRIALQQLYALGFSDKDVDDVKGIFADTNLYLLSGTVLIATCHLLFDFLAFKNDVSFWRRKRTLAGLSGRTVLWRGFSQCVIFLYLLDEQTSMLVLVPSAISAVIELWKVTKVLHLRISFTGWRIRIWREKSDEQEQDTARADAEAMRYLSMLLYPLCFAGAIYSLVYEPHKSWYSWALHSIVNGVYAFGFLFMLPQLFVNYRLRSVAALPWRAFMYKAFNTFIDDVFAFIITMPTAHRVACFRDDLVFLVYLYQRWLYPVDMSRTDSAVTMDESPESKPTTPPATQSNKQKAE